MGGLSDGGASLQQQQQPLEPIGEGEHHHPSSSTAGGINALGSRHQQQTAMPTMFLLQDIWGK